MYFSLQDLEKQNASLKEQLDKAVSEKKLIEKTTSTELEPKLEVIWSGFNENFHHISKSILKYLQNNTFCCHFDIFRNLKLIIEQRIKSLPS